jgi:site-specific DNA recombinase
MTQMKRAAIYARYSSDNQRDESIDAQVRAIEEFAKKNDIVIVGTYADKAKSATSDKRPEFQRMIKDSAAGIFEIVIVHKLDRFSRDKYDSALYKRKLRTNGIKLISITENLDDSPESVILESVIEGMAEYYSKNLAREVMKGMKETAYQCRHTGGTLPLGYDTDENNKYIINQAEAEIVRTIFDLYVNGYSYSQIIDYLNERGLRSKIGKNFAKNSIYSILANEKYSGVYIYNKREKRSYQGIRNNHKDKAEEEILKIPGGIPAIISNDIYIKSRDMMKKRKMAPAANKAKEQYLLTGLIYCGECGTAMQGNKRNPKGRQGYASYRCGCRLMKRMCDNKEIKREYVEEFVLSGLEKNILNDTAIPILVKRINAKLKEDSEKGNDSIILIENELNEINKQISYIITAITNGFTHQDFKTKMDELQSRKIILESNINEHARKNDFMDITEEQLMKVFSTFKTFVTDRNIPECKKIINDYVEKVIIYKDHVDVIFHVIFGFFGDATGYSMKLSIHKKNLIKHYKDIA